MEGSILKVGMTETASQEVLPSPANLNLLAKSHAEAGQLFLRDEQIEHKPPGISALILPEETQPQTVLVSGEYNFEKLTSSHKKPRNIVNEKTMETERMKNHTQDTVREEKKL